MFISRYEGITSMTNFVAQSWKRLLMCRPTHFDVVHKGLNAYMTMDDPVNRSTAMEQWKKLKDLFEAAGIKVDVMDNAPKMVDQVFCANSAIVWGGRAIIANMIQARRLEADASIKWFRNNNFEVYDARDHGYIMEGGGDFGYNYDRRHAYIGYGIRTEREACEVVKDVLDFTGTDVHCLRLVSEHCYHLDTALLALSQGHVLVYPGGFDKASLNLIKEINGEEKVIEISREDCTKNFATNCIPVKNGDSHGLIGMRFTKPLQTRLKDLGYEIFTTPYYEFLKSGGSLRCSVLDIGI